ncbi:GGDEF domain-containing protein [Duganella sp. PWIR1]
MLVLLLALTAALLVWHQFGMTRVIELNSFAVNVKVEDDRSNGGASIATVGRGKDIEFRCQLIAKSQWPYCKILFDLDPKGKGIDLSEFESIVAEVQFRGKKAGKIGFVVVNREDGLTQEARWETYKVNQIDGIDISSNVPFTIPLRWFAVPQWWKDMAKPPMEHSFVNFDSATRVEILTSGGVAEDQVLVIHSLRLVGKQISRSTLLGIIAAAWIAFAIAALGVANAMLRVRLRSSAKQVSLLAQVNKALELEARELVEQAHTDPLTGVFNRQGLRAELMNTSSLLAAPMTAIFIDIDHFKKINDEQGHAIGDEVLRQFAAVIASHIRSSDRLVRWGGEEFLMVCPLTDELRASGLAEQLRTVLHHQSWPMGVRVTASFGVAQHQEDSEITAVIQAADAQLYRAKRQGRDQVCAASMNT